MRSTPNLSIVIPAYNEERLLPKCLDSIIKQKTSHSFEVIVVNNNSTDKTENVARSYQNKLDLKVITEKQRGRGAARHAGFSKALGRIIFSTDADTIVPPNWIEAISNSFNTGIVAVTGACRIDDLSPTQNTIFNFIQPLAMKIYRLIFGHYWLSGFNFAIRKEAYKKTGGFNTKLNAQEDIEFGFRVKRLGKIVFLNKLPVIFSGRRFKKGLIKGTLPYLFTFVKYFWFRNSKVELSDVRD